MTWAIDIRELTVEVGGQALLNDLSLRVARGQKVVIVGPSGSGKSTLLKCVLGFARPASGRILVEGRELSAETVWSFRRSVAYVAQEPDLGVGRVRQILEQPYAYQANRGLRGQVERIPEQMARFRLAPEILNQDIQSLSGGEKQRIALVGAALLRRSIYLLDEVTSALDRASKRTVLQFFLDRREMTVLLVSHDPDVLRRADQVVDLQALPGGT